MMIVGDARTRGLVARACWTPIREGLVFVAQLIFFLPEAAILQRPDDISTLRQPRPISGVLWQLGGTVRAHEAFLRGN